MSADIHANNKRIAKNTITLYFRTFITLLVGLYTSRVMLHALGVDNYGINAVVGGIVAMSSLITGTMCQAIGRYITYALGMGDRQLLKTMFSTSINAQIVMALLAAVVLEIVGVWFLNSSANIPDGRMEAANWVLQCSIVSLIISLVGSPLGAIIVAHERMAIYAYISIVDVMLKLAICFVIMAYDGDRLILLALLQVAIAFGMQCFYAWYCRRNFEEARYNPKIFDKDLLKELTFFSGWNLINNGAWVFSTQGVSMLVNVYFGVTMNASRSIATTVNGAVQGFVGNFTMAFTPQITKSYAAGEKEYAVNLVNRGTRFTWLMMYMFIVPVCVEAEMLLKLWLGEVPPLAVLFLRFSMFESLAVSSGQNLFRLIQADGRIKMYTIHAALVAGLIFPIAWLLYKLGAPVWTAYLVFIIDFLLLNLVRFYDLKRLMTFSVRQHITKCIIPCLVVSVVSFILPIFVSFQMEPGFIRFFVVCIVSVLWTGFCCVSFGLTKNERSFFYEKMKIVYGRIIRK